MVKQTHTTRSKCRESLLVLMLSVPVFKRKGMKKIKPKKQRIKTKTEPFTLGSKNFDIDITTVKQSEPNKDHATLKILALRDASIKRCKFLYKATN